MDIRDPGLGKAQFPLDVAKPFFDGADDRVGIGTNTPDAKLDIQANGPTLRLTNTGAGGKAWNVFVNGAQGRFNVQNATDNLTPLKVDDGAADSMLSLGTNTAGTDAPNTVAFGRDSGPDITVDIQGSVIVAGTTVHADHVFDPNFELESIQEHAAFMWREKHLPALPKAPEGLHGPVNLVAHNMGILEELEKAHIYITELHSTIQQLESRMAQLEKAPSK